MTKYLLLVWHKIGHGRFFPLQQYCNLAPGVTNVCIGPPWLQMLQEVLVIPRLREAIEQATPEAWEQARMDYMTMCQFCQTLFTPATQTHPKWVNLLQFIGGGFYLVPAALAMRYREYGDWIDDAFAWANCSLADPDLQTWLAEELTRCSAESPGSNADGG